MVPKRDPSWIWRATGKHNCASRRPIAPPLPEALLGGGGGFALCAAAKGIADPLKATLTYRDGVLLALATCFTLRRRNLAEIDIGVHLRISPEGAMRRWNSATARLSTCLGPATSSLLRATSASISAKNPPSPLGTGGLSATC
jgi:hypothetical protein